MITKGYADTLCGQVHYRRVDGPGPPVILLHRTPVDSACFEPMLSLLSGRRAAIALDTPGFGQSFRPSGRPSARDFGRWLLAAVQAIEPGPVHLCAHHTGTHFAAEIACMAPGKVLSLLLNGVLYAPPQVRADIRRQIGDAPPVDEAGAYLTDTWRIMKGLFGRFDPALVHTETLGALSAPEGRNQAFDAILSQDFAGVLAQVRCAVGIIQASDDSLSGFLEQVRADFPRIPITLLGPAGMAAPELQPHGYAEGLLAFAASHDLHLTKDLSAMTDRRIQLFKSGDRFEMRQTASPRPKPGPGEVLVKVRAVSINRRDNMIMRAEGYPVGDADGFTPLSDAAGDIVEVGEGVTGVSVGDRVCSTFFQNWPSGRISLPAVFSALGAGGAGVFADHIVLSAQGVTPAPEGWSYEEAATLPCAAVTAWSSLMVHGRLEAGDWVLVQGTGGVALFGLQIAVAAGAKVIVASSSDGKLERVKALGAAATVNYVDQPDWDGPVRELTGGVQHVLELGGAGTLARSLASLACGGHLALVGALDGFGGEISAAGMIMGGQRVTAVSVGSRADQIDLIRFLEAHRVKPIIDSVYDLASADEAFDRANAGAFGKVVITLD